MKKVGLIILSILLLLKIDSFAQIENELEDTRRTVYWVKLSLSYVRDPEIRAYKYEVRLMSKKIYVGNLEEFQQEVWRGRARGTYIVEGPYTFREQAELAIKVFSNNALNDPEILNDNKTYYWYLVRLEKYQRLNSYKFVHIPAAVAEGTLKDFLEAMRVSLYNQSIAIGPFSKRIEAELSKRLFRQEE